MGQQDLGQKEVQRNTITKNKTSSVFSWEVGGQMRVSGRSPSKFQIQALPAELCQARKI
jgi:hypothetical protein